MTIRNVIFDSEDFWRQAAWHIVKQLQDCEIVVTTTAKLAKAKDCLSIRSEFKFNGQPIFCSADKMFAHRRYSDEDFVHLRSLGCMSFGKAEFVDALTQVEQKHLDDRFEKFGS